MKRLYNFHKFDKIYSKNKEYKSSKSKSQKKDTEQSTFIEILFFLKVNKFSSNKQSL